MRLVLLCALLLTGLACQPASADGHLEWVPDGYRCSVEVEGNGLPDAERPGEVADQPPAPQPVKVAPTGNTPESASALPLNGSEVCVEVLGVVLRVQEARGVVYEVKRTVVIRFKPCG